MTTPVTRGGTPLRLTRRHIFETGGAVVLMLWARKPLAFAASSTSPSIVAVPDGLTPELALTRLVAAIALGDSQLGSISSQDAIAAFSTVQQGSNAEQQAATANMLTAPFAGDPAVLDPESSPAVTLQVMQRVLGEPATTSAAQLRTALDACAAFLFPGALDPRPPIVLVAAT